MARSRLAAAFRASASAPLDEEEALFATLDGAIGNAGTAVILSDSLQPFALSGVEAVDVLGQGTALDLAALAPDACTRTALGKIWIVVRRAAGSFEILVDRAYGGYLRAWLAAARRPAGEP